MIKRVSQTVGLSAAIAFIALAVLLSVGARLDREVHPPAGREVGRLPADSNYLRSLLRQRADDAGIVTLKAVEALDLAGKSKEAGTLAGFYGQCNLARFLGDDAACRKVTIDTALRERVAPSADVPAPEQLRAKLANVLASASTDLDNVRRFVEQPEELATDAFRDLGSGIWTAKRGDSVELYVAVKNVSEWVLTDFEMGIALLRNPARLRPGASPDFYVYCDRGIESTAEPPPLAPGETAVMYCSSYRDENISEMLDGVARTQASGTQFIRLEWFALQNPFVKITDERADRDGPAFVASALDRRALSSAVQARRELQKDLHALDCKTTGTCASALLTPALALFALVASNPWLLAVAAGLLMGLAVGGLTLAGSSGRFAALGFFGIVAGAAYVFCEPKGGANTFSGFSLLALEANASYAIIGLVIWLPCYLLGMRLMKSARDGARSSSATLR
jgi:hypothetical protein